MAKRSLKASSAGIAKAKRAFERREWTQEYLASAVGLQTRQSVWKFFSGRPIERHLFIDLCFQLDLDWEDIAELPKWEEEDSDSVTQTESLETVFETETEDPQTWQWLREKLSDRVLAKCSTLQSVFSSEKSLNLEQVYTERSLLPSLSCHRWIDAATLQALHGSDAQSFETQQTSLNLSTQADRQGIQDLLAKFPHLLVYGKPGSGKTALLQALALQHLTAQDTAAQVPLFLSLRQMTTELSQLSQQSFETLLFQQCQETGITFSAFQQILREGKLLVLLDGPDELSQNSLLPLVQSVQSFAVAYPNTSIVMTCRLGMSDLYCQGFMAVELADLDNLQIQSFVQKWFTVFGSNCQNTAQKSTQQFLDQLLQSHNQRLQDFAKTPLLLHVLCWIFREQQQFPQQRSRVYHTILELLLGRWDRLRNIHRETSVSLNLVDYMTLLSKIAGLQFEAGQYFFDKKEVLGVIFDYLMQLPESSASGEVLWLESEAILKLLTVNTGILIERAYGVYSFSHLALQEYLTARRIFAQTHSKTPVSSINIDSSSSSKLLPSLAQKLQQSRWKTQHPFYHLASRVFDPRWHEVIRLTIDLVPNSELLLDLLKQQIDRSVSSDINLRSFIQWLDRKASEISAPSQSGSALRAFYYSYKQKLGLDLATKLDQHLMSNLPSELALEAKLIQLSQAIAEFLAAPTTQQMQQITSLLTVQELSILEPSVFSILDQARKVVQNPTGEQLATWCQAEGIHWAQQLNNQLMQSYDLGYNWEFTSEQQYQLEVYYRANVFLVDCLRQANFHTTEFRKTIEMTILLPKELSSMDLKIRSLVLRGSVDRKTKLFA